MTTNAIIDKATDENNRSHVYRFGDLVAVGADSEELYEGVTIPFWAAPSECLLDRTDGTIVPLPNPSPTEGDLYAAANAGWSGQLRELADQFTYEAWRKGRECLLRGRQGLYLECQTLTSASDIIKVATLWRAGAADTTNAMEFYEKASEIEFPTTPILWVSADLSTRLNLAEVRVIQGIVPTGLNLADGKWLDDRIAEVQQ